MNSPLLETRDLRVAFGGVTAVDGVTFELPKGQVRAVIGPNGAGKTTFFNALTGAVMATEGDVIFDGRSITRSTPRDIARLGIARTFQITSIFPDLTVWENLYVGFLSGASLATLVVGGRERRKLRVDTDELVERVGLESVRDTRAVDLSYGDQRVLEVSLALTRGPKLLLLDEPTAGMSARETGQMVGLVRELSGHVGIVIIEHDMEVAMDLADSVSVFDRGKMIQEGTPTEIMGSDLVRRVYLGS